MDNPLISVIVPIYMIDRYLGICIESILHQTYRNLEVILVDDGSRDRCPEICDLYAQKDGRIKVIHKPNGGLVSARKVGLRHSNGTYIGYVDGDDWIGPGFIEGLYTAVHTSEADMACAGFTRDLFSKSASFTDVLPAGIYEGQKLYTLWSRMISEGSYYRPGITTYVWNKLFKREVLLAPQSMVDDRISIGEDAAVTYPALLNCRRVVLTDNVAYHYRQREDSMLKQRASYADEAQKLKYLYDYMLHWSERTERDLHIKEQIVDYILSIAIIRSGGRLPHDNFSAFDKPFCSKKVAVYSAGTFGQQLVKRLIETGFCEVTAWLDDDCWEYRRCCLNVDPVESVTSCIYDYILIAAMDSKFAEQIKKRLMDLGVSSEKMLTATVPEEKKQLLERFLDTEKIREELKRKQEVTSHA